MKINCVAKLLGITAEEALWNITMQKFMIYWIQFNFETQYGLHTGGF